MKCKNIECENETSNKNVYCTLKCRNIYVNKYLRDYTNIGLSLSKDCINKYELNPKYCYNPNCGKLIPYDKRHNNYCNKSCSTSHSNSYREYIKTNISENGLNNIRLANRLRYEVYISEYELNPKHCHNCNIVLVYGKRKHKFCGRECQTKFYKIVDSGTKYYKSQTKFNFSLNDYPDEFDFNLISKYGWYSPSNSRKPNIGGVSRDHMLSVMDGFKLNIDPLLLSHPANCKLMVHSDNIRKHKKSSITLEELLIRIIEWDKKYLNK